MNRDAGLAEGIPDGIWLDLDLHLDPVEGDSGIRFEPLPVLGG